MREVTATEASRRFADLLDAVEHRGERFAIVRRGQVVAELAPLTRASGAAVKDLLRRHRVDRDWVSDLVALRAEAVAEDRF